MKKPTLILSVQRAFSLVELLVVIAVIAIIAAIAIPNIAGITGAAKIAKAQRNAQNVASIAAAARAAGVTNSYATVADWMAALTTATGITNQAPYTFRVDGLTPAEQTLAGAYLNAPGDAVNGAPIYSPTNAAP